MLAVSPLAARMEESFSTRTGWTQTASASSINEMGQTMAFMT